MTEPFLDQQAINAALKFVMENWTKSAPMTATQREAWLDVLCQLHPGELRKAIAKRIDDQSFRPDPYTILGIVMDCREADRNAEMAKIRQSNAEEMRAIAREKVDVVDLDGIPEMKEAREALRRRKVTQ